MVDRIKPLIILLAFAITGCTWSETQRLSFQKNCENSTEFYRRSITFAGFNHDEIASIKVDISNADNQILDSKTFLLSDTHYWYGNGRYSVELPLTEYDTRYSYNFVLNDGSSHRLHDMKMTMVPYFTMYSQNYGCEMTNYWINDQHYQDLGNEILLRK
jgi:hypothetical protein